MGWVERVGDASEKWYTPHMPLFKNYTSIQLFIRTKNTQFSEGLQQPNSITNIVFDIFISFTTRLHKMNHQTSFCNFEV